jgi:hypothetical protein
MSGFPIISGLMVVFSITTVAVFLLPLVKLAPSWLERSLYKKVDFHRRAADAIGTAMARAHNDPVHLDRLAKQHAYHRASLHALAPNEPIPEAPSIARKAA